MSRSKWARIADVLGIIGMLVGALDPLEGSVIILPGVGLVTVGAFLGRSRYRRLLAGSFALVAAGIGAMLLTSAFGGIGGQTGRSMWWGITMLPYPIGWIVALGASIFGTVEAFRRPAT